MAIRQAYDNYGPTNMSNAGDVVRGIIPSMGDGGVNYVASWDDTIPFLSGAYNAWIAQGSIVHLNSAGQFVPGVMPGTGADPVFVMPMMIYGQANNEPTSKTNANWSPLHSAMPNMPWVGTPTAGVLTAFPMCNGYEYATTEYLVGGTSGLSETSYLPNTPLTAVNMTYTGTGAYDTTAAATDAEFAGMVKPGTFWADVIIGVVSGGISPLRNKRNMLRFWGMPTPTIPTSHA